MAAEDANETKTPTGVRVSTCAGFFLVFLTAALAVGVGLIVHFVEKTPESSTALCSLETCTEMMKDTASGTCEPKPEKRAKEEEVFLPKTLKPVHYDLEMRPYMYEGDPTTFTFTGYVQITMKCLQATSDVILHSKNLNITSGSLSFWTNGTNTTAPKYISHEINKESQMLIIHLDRDMVSDEIYFVKMNFTGPLQSGRQQGFYLSSYQRGNKTIYLAATQFESRLARRAFPCFDEPQFKACFDITLVRKKELSTISNMQIDHVEDRDPGFQADVYRTTPLMSTYLVAFIVSDFEYVNGTTDRGIEFRIWSQKEFTDLLQYGLDVGMRTISHYADYLSTPFPLPKEDMVALPDFSNGAMENWGCTTFRTETLFYKKDGTTSYGQQVVLNIITHELAHQWFGDLVTMEWWNDLWLNEGFATFFGFMEADNIEPGWEMSNIFVTDQIVPVLASDGYVTSHPVAPVSSNHPYFDGISYNKAAAVLRMLKFFVGDETFRLGLIRYLRSRAYGNANHDDLWKALYEQAQEDHKTIDVVDTMRTWTLQMNYPVVSVSRAGNKQLKLTQSRFLFDSSGDDPGTFKSPYNYKWNIPFTFTTSTEKNFNVTDTDIVWMFRNDKTDIYDVDEIIPDPRDGSSWILGNIRHNGFYRVNYDKANWRNIIRQLKQDHEAIIPINRAQIINDALDLAKAGLLDLHLALGTLEYLSSELSFYPWTVTNGQLEDFDKMLRYTDIYDGFKEFMRNTSRNAFSYYGLHDPGKSHIESLARREAVSTACRYSNPDCLRKAREMFLAWKENTTLNTIHPDVRLTVLCTGISEGVADDWNFLFDMYTAETYISVRADMLDALSCSQEPWLMERYLRESTSVSAVRGGDLTRPFLSGPLLNPGLQPLSWDFIRKNYHRLAEEFQSSPSNYVKIISAATATFNTKFQLDELEHFINATSDLGWARRVFESMARQTEDNIKWMETTYPVVKKWLMDLGYVVEEIYLKRTVSRCGLTPPAENLNK